MNFKSIDPSSEEINRLLEWDALGVPRWRIKTCRKVKVGSIAGSLDETGYRRIGFGGRVYRANRLHYIAVHGSIPEGYMVDHSNNISSDDRIENLRLATDSQNRTNARIRSNNTTGHKGVNVNKKTGKIRAYINIDGKQVHLGMFESVEEASKAYQKASEEHHREFGRIA